MGVGYYDSSLLYERHPGSASVKKKTIEREEKREGTKDTGWTLSLTNVLEKGERGKSGDGNYCPIQSNSKRKRWRRRKGGRRTGKLNSRWIKKPLEREEGEEAVHRETARRFAVCCSGD